MRGGRGGRREVRGNREVSDGGESGGWMREMESGAG